MTQGEFTAQGLALSREAEVVDRFHSYFVEHGNRLYKACVMFGLLEKQLGDVLEIGPFYGYTPFLLRPNASSYTVLEGDDPAAYPLRPLYEKRHITAQFVDFSELFGAPQSATHALAFSEASFDTILCWETMEHFNFNPVKFVRELRRVLKPGGRAYITVPNKASFQAVLGLIFGRSERQLIQHYFTFEDYTCNGRKAFYGFHWREYSPPELTQLFSTAGFKVLQSDTFVAYQIQARQPSLPRLIARAANTLVASILRRYGTHVCLIAEK
jgi:SAM-dependent methyltransferase